ncbi:hypothetical protein NE237_026887 [Protea cynaroides]|uniref:Bidirectional sugar transporter SWEET n=1 Tax=Protea cynaroides TaxID=273540 RepID=A0A9Q0GMC3_9MAGN|nr:hypothetical protein NE237_026887 [Protea cynaroides]
MVSTEAARTAVGVLGNITSLILFLSPVPTFIQIWKKGSVEQYSAAPYLATLMNCMVWLLYGIPLVHPHSMAMLTINGSGFLMELTYVLLFLLYSNRRTRFSVVLMVLIEFAFVAVVAVLVLTLAHTIEHRSLVVGSIGVFFGILMYAAPLTILIPNSLGTLLGLVQLILYAKYYNKSTQRLIDERKGKGNMGLVDVVVIQDSTIMVNPIQYGHAVSEIHG